MPSLLRLGWRVVAAIGIALLITGCAPSSTTSTGSGASSDDALPPCPTPSAVSQSSSDGPSYCPTILQDTSPGQLAILLNLMIGGQVASPSDMDVLHVTFTHQGHPVLFVAGERVACNGRVAPGSGSYFTDFTLQAPSEAFSGKVVTCIYTTATTSATFTFTAPLAPAILSPREHAQVTRSSHTPITYRLSPDQSFFVIAYDPPKKAWTPTAASQPNPVLLDTSDFPSGSGSIEINQFVTLPDLHAPDFQSAQEQGNAVYEIQVNWV